MEEDFASRGRYEERQTGHPNGFESLEQRLLLWPGHGLTTRPQ